MARSIEEIEHMLLHALTEDDLVEKIEQASSQQEVYDILGELSYFDLTMEEFQSGIKCLQSRQEE